MIAPLYVSGWLSEVIEVALGAGVLPSKPVARLEKRSENYSSEYACPSDACALGHFPSFSLATSSAFAYSSFTFSQNSFAPWTSLRFPCRKWHVIAAERRPRSANMPS